jgi:hypothetical protein
VPGPGGWQLIPKVGHWVQDPTATVVAPCAYPAHVRCIGWNAAQDAVQCG